MATMAELTEQNAAIEQQMQEWRQQRFAAGENPMDWMAFRTHLTTIGAPDPGESAPDEFLRWDESMHGGTGGPAGEVRSAPQATASPDAQPHAFGKAVSEVNNLRGDPAAQTDDTATWPSDAGAGSRTSNWASNERQADEKRPDRARSGESVRPEGG